MSDLEDTESERGGIFRARDLRREGDREPRRGEPGSTRRATDRDQHQQARDHGDEPTAEVRPMRPAGPVPLPRRTPPTLVTDRGRRVDDPGDEPAETPVKATGPVPHTADRAPEEADGSRASDAPWTVRAATHRTSEPSRTTEPPRAAESSRTPESSRATEAPRVTESSRATEAPRVREASRATHEGPPAPDTVGGLPRRVRQASLARQLREESADRTPQRAPVDTFDDAERDADEVRARMASLQRGWQRGRRQNEAEHTEHTANAETTHDTENTENTENTEDTGGPGGTAPGTTPGGDGR